MTAAFLSLSADARYRLAVAVRTLAAIGGGYAVAAAAAALLSVSLPMPRAEAVRAATMLSFVIYAAAVLWAFADANLRRICAGLAGSALALAGLTWWLQHAGAAT